MSDDTGIEWTHVPGYRGATWNPVRGCTKISPGCKHCYAETCIKYGFRLGHRLHLSLYGNTPGT